MLGADAVIATRMEIVDGKYTGEIGFYAYAENKAAAMLELAERKGYDLGAATPTATRSPTSTCSRRWATRTPSTPTATCGTRRAGVADPRLHLAGGAGEPGATARAKPTLAALALGTAAAVGGAIYLGARRRDAQG